MKTITKFILILIIVGTLVILAIKIIRPILEDRAAKNASDAVETKGKIVVRIDSWAGYYPIASQRMKKSLRKEGYLLECVDDKSDLTGRMKALASGEIQFAVATVDSYILNAEPLKFPGRIIAVIDESKGGDAIVAWKESVPNLEALKGTKSFRTAYTPNSPSHQLIKAAGTHFGIPALKSMDPSRKVETAESLEALKLLLGHKVDVAVLWEPDVSKALAAGAVKLLGTENTTRLIVDVLLVNTDYAKDHPDIVALFLKTYFRTLKSYSSGPEDLKKEMCDELKLDPSVVEKMLGGVSWVNLTDNCQDWFGIASPGRQAEQGLVDTIDSTIEILRDSGDFSGNPLPDSDPYRIMQKGFVEDLYRKGLETGFKSLDGDPAAASATQGIDHPFSELTEAQWASLREVGTLKIEPIVFQTGTSDLLLEGKEDLDKIVARLKHYPTFRILVKGHTSMRGDPEANGALSLDRASAAARYLQVTYGIDPHRIRSLGLGGTKPLPREPGESGRAYDYRLPRVELSLLSEVY
ncbi:MAG: phosphate ABC transporter substrate-binding/OmpA family protein [Candidatus Paceibacterota bacterium]|jgi:outer membrane protein OmpA-like peptidoglycan-associated protein/ABC-type nitrate/sulfonate/bicarbonate transport system substrate-binding protein